MKFEDYEKAALSHACYPNKGKSVWYPTLGLTGEAGEVAEKVKKLYRDSDGNLNPDIKNALIKELGDVLWYVAAMADELDTSLEEIAKVNLNKLGERVKNNTIKGSGDNR